MLSEEQIADAQDWMSQGKDPLEWCRVNGIQNIDREVAISEIMNSKPAATITTDPVEVDEDELDDDDDLEDDE